MRREGTAYTGVLNWIWRANGRTWGGKVWVDYTLHYLR